MNIKDCLLQLSLKENIDFVMLNDFQYEMMPKEKTIVTEINIPEQEEIKIDGIVIQEYVPAYNQLVNKKVVYIPNKPSEEELTKASDEVKLIESDIALLIEKYLQGKEEYRDYGNDSFNIVDGLLYGWHFTNIKKPTNKELLNYLGK